MIGYTLRQYAKDMRKHQYMPVNDFERAQRRSARPDRRLAEKKEKLARRMGIKIKRDEF